MRYKKWSPFTDERFKEIVKSLLTPIGQCIKCQYCHKEYWYPDEGGDTFCSPECGAAGHAHHMNAKRQTKTISQLMKEEKRNKKEATWRLRYEERLIAQGYLEHDAHETAKAAEYVEDLDPVEAADDEVSYGDA